jgi:hypothetical protein
MSQAQSRGNASLEIPLDLTADERAELERLRRENTTLRAGTGRPRRKDPVAVRHRRGVDRRRLRAGAPFAGRGLDPQPGLGHRTVRRDCRSLDRRPRGAGSVDEPGHDVQDLADQSIAALAAGDSQSIVVQGGTVYLDLGPFIDAAKKRLAAEGLTAVNVIPAVHPTVALAPADQLVRAQSAYATLDSLAAVLPWITLLVLAVGVYLARVRMSALVAASLGVASALVVLAAGLLVARGLLVGAVPASGAAAAAASFDIIVGFLRASGRVVLVLALVVALGAFLAGSSASAMGVRHWVKSLLGRIRTGPSATGPVGSWVPAHVRGLRIAAVALAALLFVFLPHPTGVAILLIAAGLLVVLAVIEFLARPGPVDASTSVGSPPEGGQPSAQESPPVVVVDVMASQSLT